MPAEFWRTEQLREAFAAQHIGRVARAYRTHPYHHTVYGQGGISQTLLGQWLGLRQPQISLIETGPPIRDLDTLAYWARTLQIPAELLWFDLPGQPRQEAPERPDGLGLPATSDGTVSNATPLTTPPTPSQRVWLPIVVDGRSILLPLEPKKLARGELSPASSADGSVSNESFFSTFDFDLDELHHVAVALTNSRRYLDGSVVEYFRRQLDVSEADDGALGPAEALPTVLGILGAIEEHARDVTPDVRCELLSVGARGAEFAGWMYRDLHHPQRAIFWYARATEWAQEAGDTTAQGYILLKKSQMAYDDRHAVRVLTLAQAAQYGPWQLPRNIRVEVTQQEARGLAMVGEPMLIIEQKLDDARRLFSNTTPDEHENQLGGQFNDATLTLRTASCYIEAGKPQQAAMLYAQVLSTNVLSRRDRGYFLARRASSLALAGQPDEAVGAGLQATKVAAATTSQRTKRELMRVLNALKPWYNRPGTRELRETMATSL